MNIITKAVTAIGDAFRSFATKSAGVVGDSWAYARRYLTYDFAWGNSRGYAGNSLVYACIDARASAIASVTPIMRKREGGEEGEEIPAHPLVELLENPNRFHTWEEFIYLTEVYKCIAGEAFWQIGRNAAGRPVELWCRRPDWVTVQHYPERNEFISHYEYTEEGRMQIVPIKDMVHHRRGLNPLDTRRGLPPLSAAMMEIGLDGMATEHVTALLDNYAIPPVHIKVRRKIMNEAEADEIKRRFMAKMGGPKRGEPLISDNDTEVTVITTTPQQMEMPDLRRIGEARICAVFNVPPIVVGAYVGLEHGTYSNYAQAREAFWDECVGAQLREYRGKIRRTLQQEFDTVNIFSWNLDDVRALQEDQEKKRRFHLDELKAGAITRNEYLARIGEDQVKDGDYYLIPTSVKERKEGEFPDPLALPKPTATVERVPPAPLRALPARTGTDDNRPKALARKADDRFPGMTLRLREQLTPGMESELEQFFMRLGARAERRAREIAATQTHAERTSDASVPIDLDADRLITAKDTADLAALFSHHYALVLELTWDEINAGIGLHSPWSISDPIVQDFAARSAGRVVDITETTRDVLRNAITSAQAGGYGVDDLIRGVRDKDTGEIVVRSIRETVSGQGLYPGIYDREYRRVLALELRKKTPREAAEKIASLAAERKASGYRALNIARTELGYAANAGSVVRYKASGVVLAVRVYDGDDCGWRSHDDPDKAHGTIRNLEEAEQYTLAHPSCQRAFSAITDPAELPKDWGALSA